MYRMFDELENNRVNNIRIMTNGAPTHLPTPDGT